MDDIGRDGYCFYKFFGSSNLKSYNFFCAGLFSLVSLLISIFMNGLDQTFLVDREQESFKDSELSDQFFFCLPEQNLPGQ